MQDLKYLAMHVQELALDAVQCVAVDHGAGQKEIDIKNYAKVEKIPGGTIEDCRVLKGEPPRGVRRERRTSDIPWHAMCRIHMARTTHANG